MKNLPQKIYLNFGDDFMTAEDYATTDFKDLSDITWCEDRQDEFDHCYVDESEIKSLYEQITTLQLEITGFVQNEAELKAENERLQSQLTEINFKWWEALALNDCVEPTPEAVKKYVLELQELYAKEKVNEILSEETYSARTRALGKGIAELYRMQEQVTFSVGVEAGLSGDDGEEKQNV